MTTQNKMNPYVKKLWLKALRNGEYKQGQNQLREGNRFCCLGVLCNLHAVEHPNHASTETDPVLYFNNQSTLPYEVAHWAGIDIEKLTDTVEVELPKAIRGSSQSINGDRMYMKPDGDNCGDKWTLATLNDSGAGFRQIADIIEYNL